ncbi:ABC transporter ATP-binding protein [Streptosporangium lutulentum]|uniref:ABC transport system ATP-binding protein n=1 Tax=Streptosporangium lutulentum TaxID=1461250 RepID=A0ABT9QR95_9ACTN|nr:ABC transporter ATP-binding protein [Streptosporangium lutulentum]MDP9848945.1 putative ABC transport system ATP-binding protein [Streptosporangium lutulentum]
MNLVIHLDDVSRVFPADPPVHALSKIRLRVEQGDYLAIVGPSGSGKSTLLNTLGLLDRPTSGSYLLDGIETTTLKDGARTRLRGHRIGFVYQSFHLLDHRTVAENVMLAEVYGRSGGAGGERARNEQANPRASATINPRGEAGGERANPRARATAGGYGRRGRRRRAEEMLEKVGMSHRVDFLPGRLSGGERQRVAIARALMGGPSLLLCDEPTGNLDSRNTEAVLDLFDGLRDQGLTLLVITHEDAVSARASRRVRISDGVLTEE